jgi:hypothetical protein
MDKPTVDEVLEGLAVAREGDIEEPNRYTAVMVTASARVVAWTPSHPRR